MKILLQIIKYIFILALIIVIYPYITCPVYKYPEPSQFKGNLFYNPYSDVDSALWLKVNLHTHSKVWYGLTAGKKSEAKELVKKYKELDYHVIGISDYHFINPLSSIPVYEHGIGIFKNHQLSIGADEVLWKDYLFYQNFHHKQNIISGLRAKNNLISINHPEMRDAYDGSDMKYLRGYDLLEVVNHNYFNALHLWDTVLSAGNPVFLIADDDSHDITNPKDYGYVFTLVNSPSEKTPEIIDALRNGKTIGIEMEPKADMSPSAKLKQAALAPILRTCAITNDSLIMRFNLPCDTVKLIGQNGKLLARELKVSRISYRINPEDTYIRAEINQSDLTNIAMNPVFRYEGKIIRQEPEIDSPKTWLFRTVCLVGAALIIFMVFRLKKKKKYSDKRTG